MSKLGRGKREAAARRRLFEDALGDAEIWQNPRWKTKRRHSPRPAILSRLLALCHVTSRGG
jgi:hypothetical protein